jgi:hypothetical protein
VILAPSKVWLAEPGAHVAFPGSEPTSTLSSCPGGQSANAPATPVSHPVYAPEG